MSTLRQDSTTNEWVILAPQRSGRPHRSEPTTRPELPEHDPSCPFCPGNEDRTPPEIARSPADGAWALRAFPNLYAALEAGDDDARSGSQPFREMAGIGSHEVIVESPRHDDRLDEMAPDAVAGVLQLWRSRYRALTERTLIKAVVIFKNFGERAGTSLVHPHSQIVATPVVPPDALRRHAVAVRHYDDTGRCVYEDLREAEIADGRRMIAEREHFVALAPFAAGSPHEAWIMPRRREPSFGRLGDAELPDLAELVRDLLGALREVAGDPDFNLLVQSSPAHEENAPYFLWHLRLLPRISTHAGFELGSGMSINTVAPEDSAAQLRTAMRKRKAA